MKNHIFRKVLSKYEVRNSVKFSRIFGNFARNTEATELQKTYGVDGVPWTPYPWVLDLLGVMLPWLSSRKEWEMSYLCNRRLAYWTYQKTLYTLKSTWERRGLHLEVALVPFGPTLLPLLTQLSSSDKAFFTRGPFWESGKGNIN
jgi:hypothetical protein